MKNKIVYKLNRLKRRIKRKIGKRIKEYPEDKFFDAIKEFYETYNQIPKVVFMKKKTIKKLSQWIYPTIKPQKGTEGLSTISSFLGMNIIETNDFEGVGLFIKTKGDDSQ